MPLKLKPSRGPGALENWKVRLEFKKPKERRARLYGRLNKVLNRLTDPIRSKEPTSRFDSTLLYLILSIRLSETFIGRTIGVQ